MTKILILEIGPGREEYEINDPRKRFPEDSIERIDTLDIDKNLNPTYLHNISEKIPESWYQKYDVVFASHVLEHIDRHRVLTALRNMYNFLKVGGELYIMVPSLEWVASEIMLMRETPMIQGLLYGGQLDEYDYHRVGFTLYYIRFLIENGLGMTCRRAFQSPYMSTINGHQYMGAENVIIAHKYEHLELKGVDDERDVDIPTVLTLDDA